MTKYEDITCYNDFLINKKKSEIAMIKTRWKVQENEYKRQKLAIANLLSKE